MTPRDALVKAITRADEASPWLISGRGGHADLADAILAKLPEGWALVDEADWPCDHDECVDRDDLTDVFRRNHGERGHPEPFAECRREVCLLGRHVVGGER